MWSEDFRYIGCYHIINPKQAGGWGGGGNPPTAFIFNTNQSHGTSTVAMAMLLLKIA